VIPNGVPVLDASRPTGDLRQELGLPADARLVGFVGRLAPQKCLKDLIWGFHLLKSSTENVFLVLVGDGPLRDELGEFASSLGCRDLVHFLGHRNDAADVTRQLTAFCLPSSFEGMSNSLMDAMAAGLPVAVSDIPANQELIRHETNGLVFEQGQGPKIGMALKRLIDDTAFAGQLGTAAKSVIATQHGVQQLVDRHVDLYRRLSG
jgi:glycosyltransferase involved in cell wall biosynthesis